MVEDKAENNSDDGITVRTSDSESPLYKGEVVLTSRGRYDDWRMSFLAPKDSGPILLFVSHIDQIRSTRINIPSIDYLKEVVKQLEELQTQS